MLDQRTVWYLSVRLCVRFQVICAIFFMMFTWIAMSVLPIMSAYSSWTETYCIPGEGTAMAQCLALADEEETPAEE